MNHRLTIVTSATLMPVGAVVKDIAIGAGGHRFDTRAGQIDKNVAIAATFLRSCVAQALLSRGDERSSGIPQV